MTPHRRLVAARAGYVAVVLLATLADLHFSPDMGAARERLLRALAPTVGWRDAIDGLRNAALFAGLGAVWMVTSTSGRMRRDVLWATLAGAALSASVESLQCFSPVRMASLFDVATNAAGAFAGAAATAFLLSAVRKLRDARSYLGVPALVVAGAYGLATLGEALTPLFRSDIVFAVGGGPIQRFALSLNSALPLTWAEVQLLDIPLYAVAGFLCVLWAQEAGRSARRGWWVTASLGVPLVLAAHVVHGALGLPIRLEAAFVDAVALVCGAWLSRDRLMSWLQRFRGAQRARLTIASYSLLLVIWGWRPFFPRTSIADLAAQLTPVHLVPLASLAERRDVFSAVHVAQQFLLYLPLGALLAVWPLRLSGRLSHLWPAVWLAAGIEAGHLLLSDRYFDATNAIVAMAGLGVGWIALRRSGLVPLGEALGAAD